jgi:hypothetical protein
MLKIKRGSVFDEKCDLLILPCSSSGSVTSWVRSEIEQNNLPFPSARTPFGQVRFLSTEARYTKADFVGYAASVDAKTTSSTQKAIETIASDLVGYCKKNDCSIVNIPLLGTGAGGLDPVEVFDIFKRIIGDEPILFNAYAPDKKIYELIISHKSDHESCGDSIDEHPRIFISYSWKEDSVRNWVLELAHKLCANGVDARLDRFHLRPGMDVPQWMTNEVLKAHKVLLVCDAHYAEKADMRKAGVGWETMIIQGDMMMQGDMNTKYIVIAYGDFEKNTPIYMKSKLAISKVDVDKDINLLLQHIFDVDTAPEIGKIPEWVKSKRKRA